METEEEQNGELDLTLEYDELVNSELEEFVTGDCGPFLVVSQTYFTPREAEGDA